MIAQHCCSRSETPTSGIRVLRAPSTDTLFRRAEGLFLRSPRLCRTTIRTNSSSHGCLHLHVNPRVDRSQLKPIITDYRSWSNSCILTANAAYCIHGCFGANPRRLCLPASPVSSISTPKPWCSNTARCATNVAASPVKKAAYSYWHVPCCADTNGEA